MRFPWTQREPDRSQPLLRTVVLFGKPGCHLCEDARALLDAMQTQYPHTVEDVDIRTDPQLFRRYDIRIPVVTVDGGPEIEPPLTEAVIRAALDR